MIRADFGVCNMTICCLFHVKYSRAVLLLQRLLITGVEGNVGTEQRVLVLIEAEA